MLGGLVSRPSPVSAAPGDNFVVYANGVLNSPFSVWAGAVNAGGRIHSISNPMIANVGQPSTTTGQFTWIDVAALSPVAANYRSLQFKIKATPTALLSKLSVSAVALASRSEAMLPIDVTGLTPDASGYYTVTLDLTQKYNPEQIGGLKIQGFPDPGPTSFFEVNNVTLLNETLRGRAGLPLTPTSTANPSAPIDCTPAGLKPVDPRIFGLGIPGWRDASTTSYIWQMAPSSIRWGGDGSTMYNKTLNVANTGFNNNFTNTASAAGVSWQSLISTAAANPLGGPAPDTKAGVAFTLPALDWVAKDATSSNGGVAGTASTVAIPWTPALSGAWAAEIASTSATSSVRVDPFFLENEPDIWHGTHPDAYTSRTPAPPAIPGYDFIKSQLMGYALQARSQVPTGQLAGPSFSSYVNALGTQQASEGTYIDYGSHGNQTFIKWYLSQMNASQRLVDVLDQHYYPQPANGAAPIYGAGVGAGIDLPTAKLRIRSTRALWDQRTQMNLGSQDLG
jgi:hypothetical protein